MKKAVMYGAGNIGRGFIGQLFSQSGYEVVFLDINPVIIEKLNTDHCYPVRIAAEERYDEIIVGNVRGVNAADPEPAIDEMAAADIMATAVGVNVLPGITGLIALGLKKRWKNRNFTPLNIIICENLLDANHYLEKLIKQELNNEECGLFDRMVGLVEASIGRMVPVMTPEMQGDNPLRVYVEEYCELPVDRDAFKGEIPYIVNMVPFSPFGFYIRRKLFMHNMGHATAAYMGFLCNCKYIWEACRNPAVKLIVLKALMESSLAMSREHDISLQLLLEHADDLIYRFGNRLLGDTIDRVGKDPVRKLSENDRLTGAAKLCLKQGVNPVYISLGIAAGFMFSSPGDGFAGKIQDIIRAEGIESALLMFCNLSESNPIHGIVLEFYRMLKRGDRLEEIIEMADKIKNRHQVKYYRHQVGKIE